MDAARLEEVFMDVQQGLPRQGPGNDAATRRAISCCTDMPEWPDVLDIDCGPGQQSLVLAKGFDAQVTAIDIHQEYLDQLATRSESAGLAKQITPMLADMSALAFEAACFDLVWAEGSAYIMGVANALQAWKPLLRPRAHLVLSELLWLSADPPPEAFAFFAEEYPAMTDIAGNLAIFSRAGYRVTDHFTIPSEAWWDDYYTPLKAKVPSLLERYRGEPEALQVVQSTAAEIEIREAYGESYGYEFFIAQLNHCAEMSITHRSSRRPAPCRTVSSMDAATEAPGMDLRRVLKGAGR